MAKKTTTKTTPKVTPMNFNSMLFGITFGIIIIYALLQAISTELFGVLAQQIITATLILLGLIIGLINIDEKETVSFLTSILVFLFLVQTSLPLMLNVFNVKSETLITLIRTIVVGLSVTLAPAGIVVALKTFFRTTRD
jgi:hypothetical protein